MGRTTRLHQAIRPQRAARARTAEATDTRLAGTAARSPLVALQHGIGNRAVGRLVQAKLRVGTVDDPLEREADRVADQVTRLPARGVFVAAALPQISRKCAACEEEAEKLHRKPARTIEANREAPATVHKVLRSPGQPLDGATRAYFEPRFRHDFSRVRTHTGALAEQSARDVNAHAYTLGNDIVFGAGRLAPESREGGRLLAHELTHVVQQSGGAAAVQRQRGAPDPSAERAPAVAEAEAVASVTSEQLIAQSDAEDALKLNWRKRKDKNYAWSLGLKDRASTAKEVRAVS